MTVAKAITICSGVGGALILGASVTFAAGGSKIAFMPVVTSNLSMVLALASTAALVLFSIIGYQVWHKGKDGNSSPAFSIFAGIIGLIIAGITYAGIHVGIGYALAESFALPESLAIQGGISFFLGAAITACCLGFTYKIMQATQDRDPTLFNSENLPTAPKIIITTIVGGLICTASTTIGPLLSECMGKAAADTAEKLSMEAMLAFAITSLTLVICASIYKALKQEIHYISQIPSNNQDAAAR